MLSRNVRVLLVLGLAGCGSSAGPGDGQPYVTMVGSIRSVLTDIHHPVRAAVVWVATQGGAVSQDFAVAGSFPAQFTLPLTELPPNEAMRDAPIPNGPSVRIANGTLIVYEDLNENGKLDLVSLQQPAVDRILGTLTNTELVYAEGQLVQSCASPSSDCFSAQKGFSLISVVDAAPNPDRACEPSCPWKEGAVSQLPLETLLSITLTGSPELAPYMCQSGGENRGGASAGSPPSLPPAGAEVFCSADGTAYDYQSCDVPTTPCGPKTCVSGWGTRDPSSAVPAGWPCH